MAKSWQYGRWRSVVLQVVMCGVFGASLGLAAFIDHRRSGSLDVQLGTPVTDGRLSVRLPVGWDVLIKQKGEAAGPSPRALTVIDFDRQGRERRRLTVTQEEQAGRSRGAEYYLENLMSSRYLLPLEPQPFSMLGEEGVLIPFKVDIRRYVGRGAPADLPEPGLYACVVMPDGLAVTVQVRGDGAYGPSSHRLLRQVADTLRLAYGTSAGVPTGASATAPTR